MRVQTSTPFLAGAPGESLICRVRVENDSDLPASFQLRVVGFDEDHVVMPPSNGALAAGAVTEIDVQLTIPDAFAPGNHALGVEVRSDRGNAPPSLAPVTVSVGSVSRLLLTVNPSTVRGNRSAKFWVDVLNRDDQAVDLELAGESPGLKVRVKPRRVTVAANQRMRARGRVSGRVRLLGETRQQPFTVSARSHSAPTFSTGTYQQRPLLPRGFRMFIAILTALAIWAGALGAGLIWWGNRNDDQAAQDAVELVDIDGDGKLDTPAEQLVDTDGDGVPDTPAAVVAAEVAAEGPADEENDEPAIEAPAFSRVIGTVLAGETGQNDGVLVTLTPIELGAQPSAEAQAFAGGERAKVAKLWPARYGSYAASGATAVRQTTTVTDVSEGIEGAFLIPDVLIHQTYEVNFAKAGFDSRSFVVTPPETGDPVEMEIVLEPSDGELGGTVVGPGGPLGNVDIVATDGTLTFNTTSSSDPGQLGRFSLPAVNTPATYTITANLRGYGTEVIQVPLGAGDRRTDLVISMQLGVGSIIGRVTANGGPLGGVTLTVSNGDVTRTTTSLTEGDVGLYNFPQLPLPGTYTVTASNPGYITQTRLVTLAGNTTGVDFDLTTTTASITGLVVSNARGPLPGASITIARDDLTFRALSAAAPQPGAFTIDDLPPGTYLVRFARFDHAETSQLVTLAAGEVRDLGEVSLVFTDVPDLPATGSVNVSVVDSQGAALRGATVRLVDVSTLETIAIIADDDENQSTFLFETVPVGTYNVVVDRRLYRNTSARVSVGLGPQSVTVAMFLLGQVSGRVVDSLTNAQLDDYAVSIFRVNPDTTSTFVEQVSVREGQAPDPLTGEVKWESSPNLLTTGSYRVEISDPPPGYRVLNDQSVDPNRPANPPMQFEILPTVEDPLELNDIEADPFPNLSGRIFKPVLVDPATDEVEFVPIDDDGLAVSLSCPGAPDAVDAELSDGVPAVPGLDSYEYDPIALESKALLGACVLAVSAPGFVTASVTLDPPLVPSDGETRTDQVVNVALVAPTDPISGDVVWIDSGVTPQVERAIDAISIVTEDPVIIGFERAQGTDPDAMPTPIFTTAPLSSTSVSGSWNLSGQVFGQATYQFIDPARFPTGRMSITIDESTNRQVAAIQNLTVEDRGAGGGIHVILPPRAGRISGAISIISVNPPRYADASIASAGPDGLNPSPAPDATDGSYTIDPAPAGTWRLAYAISGDAVPSDPRDYALAPGTVTSQTTLVNPGATVDLPATTFIEHPRLDVRVVDTRGNPIAENGVTPTVTISATGVATTSQAMDPATGGSTFRRLAFDAANPDGTPVSYSWSVTMPGYDPFNGTATAVLNGASGFTSQNVSTPLQGTVGMRAGAKPLITITLPKFGSLSGNVIGRLGSLVGDATEPIPFTDPSLTVRARRVASFVNFGFDARLYTRVNDAPIAAFVDPNDPTGFRVSGPPGIYVFEIVHEQFFGPVGFPPQLPDCFGFVCPPGTIPRSIVFEQGAYLMDNAVDTDLVDPFVMELKRMQVRLRVITDRASATPVDFADVLLTAANGTLRRTQSDPAGNGVLADVIPGTNRLFASTRDFFSGLDRNYPVIANVVVPRFGAANGGVVTLTVVMPQLGAAMGGQVGAVNSEGDPVALPEDFVIDRAYRPSATDIDGASFDNTASEAGDVRFPGGAPPPTQLTLLRGATPQTPVGYTFNGIARGVHALTFSVEAGYTPPSPNPQTVTATSTGFTLLPRFDYRANDVRVVVDVTSLGDPFSTATVRLVSPDAGDVLVPTVAGGTYTFAAVPPEVVDYTLTVTDPIHANVSQPLTVAPDADGVIGVAVALTPTLGRIEGIAQRDPGTGAVPLAGQGTVEIRRPDGTSVATATPGPTGNYLFDVPDAGNYVIVVSFAGHATRSTTVTGVVVGRVTTAATVTIPALASAVLTVTDVLAEDAASIAVTVTQPAGSGLTPTRVGDVFTVAGLDPDVAYRFRVTAAGYQNQLVPSNGTLDPSIGTAHPFTVVMDQRRVVVTVQTEDDFRVAEQSATVRLRIPASGSPISPTSRDVNEYRFARVSIGAGQVTVDATGYRTRQVDVDASTDNVRVTANLLKLVTIAGTVTRPGGGAAGGATVTATSGSTSRSAVTDASGQYSIPSLDVGTWSLAVAVLGQGAATGSVVVTADSASAVTQNLTLVPRNVTVTFNVSAGAPAVALAGANVRVDGVSSASPTDAAGVATVAVPENGPLAWTVSAADRITQNGTITLSALAATVAVTLVDRPTLNGTVTSEGANLAGATVYLCPSAPTACTAVTAVDTQTSSATGTFAFRPDVGTWQATAVLSARVGTITGIAVTAAGAVTPNNITVVVPPPVP